MKPGIEIIAKILLVNEHREALILTLGEHKARPDRSYLPDLPGGIVDPGESSLMAAVRELSEETGITLETQDLTLGYAETQFYQDEAKSVTKILYIARTTDNPEIKLSWEHSAYEWMSIEKVVHAIDLRASYNKAVAYCLSHELL